MTEKANLISRRQFLYDRRNHVYKEIARLRTRRNEYTYEIIALTKRINEVGCD